MLITSLHLLNFRSYESFHLEDIGRLTVFVGPNASGKTNAVESIQMLTALASFRGATSSELVRQGCDTARIQARLEGDGRILDVAMSVADGRRSWSINGKRRQAKSLRGVLPSIAFTPDDLQLVKGSNRHRRRELDVLGSQLNANYHQITRDFEKILHQKNSLLKEDHPPALLDAINDVFSVVGEQYSNYRQALFDRLMPIAAKHYRHIANASSNEELGYRYKRSWEGPLDDAVFNCKAEEASRHRTLIGPHLDELNLEVGGLDASTFASQGQQRSVVLALKLAEVELVEEMLGHPPVLLLDDVMSELDASRREALVERVLQGSQTFVTTANIDYFDPCMLEGAKLVNLPMR